MKISDKILATRIWVKGFNSSLMYNVYNRIFYFLGDRNKNINHENDVA